TGLDVGDLRPDLFHHSGRLVTEDGGSGVHVLALDEVEVAVAHTGRGRADQDLTGSGLADVDLVDLERRGDGAEQGSFHRTELTPGPIVPDGPVLPDGPALPGSGRR